MGGALKIWNWAENTIVGLLTASALAIALYDMGARILDPDLATGVSEEVIVYLIIWALFLTASTLTHENRHVRADILLLALPAQGRRAAEILNALVGLAFFAVLLPFAFDAAYEAWDFGDVSVGDLRFPLWIYSACLPVGCALLILRYLHKLYLLVLRFSPALVEQAGPDHGTRPGEAGPAPGAAPPD